MTANSKFVTVPAKATDAQLEAAYTILMENRPNTAAKAKRLVAEIYEVMMIVAPAPPVAANLSQRQQEAMQAICEYVDKHRYPPTIKELGDILGVKERRAKYLITKLRERGWLYKKHAPWQRRAIRIKKRPSVPFRVSTQ